MLREEVEIYSKKYNVNGVVRDYGFVTKLFFTYEGKDVEMGIKRNILADEKLEDAGLDILESYIDNLSKHVEGQKLQLHYWYIEEYEKNGEIFSRARGIVTGHKKLQDSYSITTTRIKAIHIDEEEQELIVTTRNSVYHCPLAYCRFAKQDKYPDLIPDYEELKLKYEGKIEYPSIEPGKVLLVLANYCEFYFHSLYYVPKDSKDGKQLEGIAYPHIGTFQDSFLITTEDHSVDIRYFPHYQNIEFYSRNTDGCPLFVENIGDSVIFVRISAGTIKLEPGERKEVKKENVEAKTPPLPGGDLYPAGVVE